MNAGSERPGAERLYRKWCGPLFGLLALALILWTLFAGDGIGLSNNGDFGRVMRAASLSFGPRTPSHTYVDTYVIDLSHGSALANVASILFGATGLGSYPSVQVALVRLSVVANLVVNKLLGWEMSTYHIQVLGAMQAVMYAAGIGLLASQIRLRWIWQDAAVKLAALLVLCDIGYVAYFNSFYGEGLEHIGLVWCAAMLVRVLRPDRVPTGWDGLWCVLCAAVYGWAKFFNIPLAILALIVLEGIVLVRSGKRRALALGGGAAALLLAVWIAVPGWMDIETNYNAVFYGVVRGVDRATAERYLADLGLPEELADYRDTNYYLAGVVDSLEERGLLDEAESVGKADLVKFYLTHPGRLWEQAELTALHCGMVRPYYLANYGAGHPLMTCSARMSLWSAVRDWLALDSLGGCAAVTAAALAMAVWLGRRRMRPLWLALLLLALLGALCYSFLLPVICNGEGDFAKHMFPYVELTDLLLLACLALALDRAERSRTGAVCPLLGGALALALILPPAWSAAAGLWRDSQSHPAPEAGAYVVLGSYEGQPLTWLITGETEAGFTLLCADESISLPFDTADGNDWASSTAREWLNGDFLAGFREDELALIRETDHPVILPDALRDTAERGDLDFACSHIAVLSDRLWERAWQVSASDRVRLPDIHLAASLAREGYDIAGRPWWLDTPYCPSGVLTRYVGADGHVYFGEANVPRVLRPVVDIGKTPALSGSGSRGDPFILA